MTPLQLALLIVGIGAAIAIFWVSRRSRGELKDWNPDGEDALLPKVGKAQQLDMFSQTGQFDEFGVGKARKVDPAAAASPQQRPQALAPKTIALLLAEREGTHILGTKIHTALKGHGLHFGQGEIYHRMSAGEPVFSVAGLLKPGTLNPADAARLSTPGLSMFISFPGPLPAVTAFREFIGTAQSLANALNAEVLDMRKNPLTPEMLAQLDRDVEAWARANPML